MRSFIPFLLLALAGCVSAAGPTRVEGSYIVTGINGQALPALSPTEEGVTMLGAALLLAPDGRFRMQATASTGTEPDASGEDIQGGWSVRGDSLSMLPDVRDSGPGPSFRWTLDRRTLTLYDEDGNEYIFRRR